MQDIIAFDETIKYLNNANKNISYAINAIGPNGLDFQMHAANVSLSNAISNINNTYKAINNTYNLVASDNMLIAINNEEITNGTTSLTKTYKMKMDGSIRLVIKSWQTNSNSYTVNINAVIKKNGIIQVSNFYVTSAYVNRSWVYSNVINVSNNDNITINFTFSKVNTRGYLTTLIPAFAYIGADVVPTHSNLFSTWTRPSKTEY